MPYFRSNRCPILGAINAKFKCHNVRALAIIYHALATSRIPVYEKTCSWNLLATHGSYC